MRVLLVALVWVVAVLGALAALFSAYIGRADFGDGGASRMSAVDAALLLTLAVLSPALAWWVTKRLLR